MKKHTIVIVNDFAYVNGGASEVAISSAIELAKKNNVYFFSAVGPVNNNLAKSEVKTICLNQQSIIDEPNFLKGFIQGLWNFKARKEFKKLIDKLDPKQTIIHIHTWPKSLSSSLISTIFSKGFKNVITMHDYFLACPNGAFYNYKKKKICTLKPMSVNCIICNCDKQSYAHKIWRLARHFIQTKVSKMPYNFNQFIKVSDFSAKILNPFLPQKAEISAVHNPIDIQKQEPVVVSNKSIFVFIGSLDYQKGLELFTEATQKIKVDALVIGDGPLKEELQLRYEKIVFSGWLNRQSLIGELKKCRVLILPSVWYETQGLVVLEAAALGIPAIVPDTSAAKDLVINGETGLHFEGGSIKDLASKIKKMKDNNVASTFGNNAYNKYWNNPSTIKSHGVHLQKIYDKLIKT